MGVFLDCGFIIAQAHAGCFGIWFGLDEKHMKIAWKTGSLWLECGKGALRQWKTHGKPQDSRKVFLVPSIRTP